MTSGVCPRGFRALTVLFVDDDSDTLFAYQLVATEAGMIVEIARDGHEAIALANAVSPDVIVLDLGLRSDEGLDGLEVARRLRASECTSSIPIVIVSGSDGERDKAAVQASGCDGYLVKPCSAEGLVQSVTTLALGRPRPGGFEQRGQVRTVGRR
jgi:two-component system KDP operon response regulator KdpE